MNNSCLCNFVLIFSILFMFMMLINYNQRNSYFTSLSNKKKIAFMFLIYDEIYYESLWYDYLKPYKDYVNIYIHYKISKPLSYFEEYKLHSSQIVPTQYANKSLIYAQQSLIFNAFNHDEHNTQFILVSQACIPLKPFEVLYNELIRENESPKSRFTKFNNDHIFFICRTFKKIHQWCVLNRRHVGILLSYDIKEYIETSILPFCFAPEELFYFNFLHKYDPQFEQHMILASKDEEGFMFTNWNYFNSTYPFIKNDHRDLLTNYDKIEQKEIDYILKRSYHLIGRKFNKDCQVLLSVTNNKVPLNDYIRSFLQI